MRLMRLHSHRDGLRLCSAWFGLVVLAFAAPVCRADRLFARGSQNPVEGRAVQVDDAGVLFRVARASDSIDTLYTWDRVRLLETDREGFAERFAEFRDLSEKLWRARSRVERQDYAAAEPILDPLFSEMMGRTDATALVVAEGLLRCRLARSARAAAVIPWLEMHRLLNSGIKPAAYLDMAPIVDPSSGVCPQLPPLWTRTVGVEQLLSDLDHYVVDAPATERLAALYARGARLALGARVQDAALFYHLDEEWRRDPAALMVTAVLAAVEKVKPFPVEVDRTFARLYRETGPLTPWAYFARGLARVVVSDVDTQRGGLVDLLTVPALFGGPQPYLAGFALDAAADALEDLGRSEDAASLRAELKLDYPTHPLNDAAAAPRIAATEKKQ
ncbi:MAG: hypothetical protein IT430_08360 [Phycisphaerales bacterium]|nr:hypothetical protein [Phycisphaerales bacterium]